MGALGNIFGGGGGESKSRKKERQGFRRAFDQSVAPFIDENGFLRYDYPAQPENPAMHAYAAGYKDPTWATSLLNQAEQNPGAYRFLERTLNAGDWDTVARVFSGTPWGRGQYRGGPIRQFGVAPVGGWSGIEPPARPFTVNTDQAAAGKQQFDSWWNSPNWPY